MEARRQKSFGFKIEMKRYYQQHTHTKNFFFAAVQFSVQIFFIDENIQYKIFWEQFQDYFFGLRNMMRHTKGRNRFS
jgi:hypothetical protein